MRTRLWGNTSRQASSARATGTLRRLPLVVVMLTGWAATAAAAPGDLDTTFAGTGKTTTAIGSAGDSVGFFGAATQVDGKIVVSGTSVTGGNNDLAVVRYNPNGTLDTTFDGDGKVVTAIGAGSDGGSAVAIQTDGRIVVCGSSSNGSNDDFAVVRYNTNGTLDTGFDGDGKATTAIGLGQDSGFGIAIQADGKIVVSGVSNNGTNFDVAVVRFNTNGTLDTSFDGDGKATTAIGLGHDFAFGVAIQADGKIVVSGFATNGIDNDFAVVRYTTTGTLDSSFDGDGKAITAIGASHDSGFGVAIQADGRIVVSGASLNGGNNDVAVVRYTTTGTLDTTFDGDGKAITAIGAGNDAGIAVAIQANGKIVVSGISSNGSNDDVAVVRYNTNGTLDSSFDGDGRVTTAIGAGNDSGIAVAIQANGRIVVGGSSSNGADNDFSVVRYVGDGICGDAVVNPGEQCDLGGANGSATSCCTKLCQFRGVGQTCRGSAGVCDLAEVCDGAGDNCPANGFVSGGTECRAVAGVCDVAEACTGSSPACPTDGFGPNSIVCRPTSGGEVCDVAESCTGSGAACPADAVEPNTTECRAAAGVCDVAESCDGTNKTCPADAAEPNTTVCRASDIGEVCDGPESCDGVGVACPADAVEPNTTVCRAAAGVCDAVESCDGSSKFCGSDGKLTTVCRADAGACDVAESCDGVADTCPVDGFEADNTSCADVAYCNGTETCQTGVCSAGTSPCSMGESCDEGTQLCFLGNCPSTKATACLTATKSKLLIKDNADDSKDKLVWKFGKGQAFTQGDFANPTTTSDYTLCFYAGTAAALINEANVPASATLFSALSDKGYKYKDPARTQAGLSKVLVRGGDLGKTRALAKGKGTGLPDFTLPIVGVSVTDPVIVQLRNQDTGKCLTTSFDSPKKNISTQFSAEEP